MANIKVTLPGGVCESWSMVKCAIGGVPVVGITEIEVSEKQTKTNEYGAGVDPVYRGYGNKEYSGKISLFSNVVAELQKGSTSGSLLDIPMFNIVLVVVSLQGGVPRTITLKSCDFLENVFMVKQGDTKIIQSIPLVVGSVQFS